MDRRRPTIQRFINDPSSVRWAAAAIIMSTAGLVVIGALVMRIFDADEYPTIGGAFWFTLQTVTTVGYGDNPPTSAVGRAIASVVMLVSIGLIAVVTAGVAALFVHAAGARLRTVETTATSDTLDRLEASLLELHRRFDRLDPVTTTAPGADESVDDAGDGDVTRT